MIVTVAAMAFDYILAVLNEIPDEDINSICKTKVLTRSVKLRYSHILQN